jgi:hypothetical protein
MLEHLKSFLTLTKKEVRKSASSDFIAPILRSIKKDVLEIGTSLQNIQRLIDKGFKINFDKIPAEFLKDLIEKTQEFSALVESSGMPNKVKLTELIGKMHDNASKLSGMIAFLVNSNDPDLDMNKINEFFDNIKTELKKISSLV